MTFWEQNVVWLSLLSLNKIVKVETIKEHNSTYYCKLTVKGMNATWIKHDKRMAHFYTNCWINSTVNVRWIELNSMISVYSSVKFDHSFVHKCKCEWFLYHIKRTTPKIFCVLFYRSPVNMIKVEQNSRMVKCYKQNNNIMLIVLIHPHFFLRCL